MATIHDHSNGFALSCWGMWILQLPAGKSKGRSLGNDKFFWGGVGGGFRKALITHWPLVFFVNAKQSHTAAKNNYLCCGFCLKCDGICVVCVMLIFFACFPCDWPFLFLSLPLLSLLPRCPSVAACWTSMGVNKVWKPLMVEWVPHLTPQSSL